MLLQFSVENFLSFREEVTLNMVPAKSRLMRDHIIEDNRGKKASCLPIAAIYGANASGKSNLVAAIDFARNLILSATHAEGATSVTPFRLDVKTETAPSRFEFVFKHDGVLYSYGFVVDSDSVQEEWLFARYTSQESKVFERATREGKVVVQPGSRLAPTKDQRQFIRFIAQATRPDQLFLTEAAGRQVGLLRPVICWFRDHLRTIPAEPEYLFLADRVRNDPVFAKLLSRFLSDADTGISSLHTSAEKSDPDKHLSRRLEGEREAILESLRPGRVVQLLSPSPDQQGTLVTDANQQTEYLRLKTMHTRNDGNTVDFDLSAESDGTRRLMNLAPVLLESGQHERVYIVDELDRSFHSLLSRKFVRAFLGGIQSRVLRGQFIFTTHDTSLLDREYLRRDEIWFAEKDKSGASHLTSLAEYKVSEGLRYANGYLSGRFGAIPILGDIQGLLH